MELTLLDRIMVMTMIPKKGNFEKLIIAADLEKKVALTQDEIKEFEIKTGENGAITWKATDKTFSYEFTELESKLVQDALKEASDKGELTKDHMSIYRLFVTKE